MEPLIQRFWETSILWSIRSEHGDAAIPEGLLEEQLVACNVEVTAPMQDVIDKTKKGR
jgi:hypothetical protein